MTSPQQIEIPPPSPDDVLYEKRETFAVITLNRPVVKGTVLSDLGITDRGIKNLFNRKAAGDVEGAVSNLKKNLTVLRMARL